MEFKEFEERGLKIDKERVLTYSKLSCPLEGAADAVEYLRRKEKYEKS